jgi:hypothetical protein
MFRSSTIIRKLVLSLAKVITLGKIIGYVAVWRHVLEWCVCCVLCRSPLFIVCNKEFLL